MCGIAGIVDFSDPERRYTEEVQRMTGALSHRGPDYEDYYSNACVYLGHRRLSIIDLSAAGNQPKTSADGRYTIIYNGEIYNYRELRKKTDYPYSSNCDTEVILACYQRWGANCLQFFRGMFAFAIWDNVERTLFMARDRLGKKPLYYTHDEGRLIFASEIRAILASGLVERLARPGAVVDFLRFQTIFNPHTLLRHIRQVGSGKFIRFSSSGFQETRWWNPEAFIDNRSISKEDACSRIRDLLENSVRERLVSDVPFGAFLSGGVDSSIVVSLMAKHSSTKVRTFSITFSEKQYSEEKYSRLIAAKYNTDHTEILLRPSEFLEKIPQAINSMDHPSGDGLNTYVVAEVTARSGIKMALSGLGGDELFGGYHYFQTARKIEYLRNILNASPHRMLPLLVYLEKLVRKNNVLRKLSDVIVSDNLEHFNYYPYLRKVWTESDLGDILGPVRYKSRSGLFPKVRNTKKNNWYAAIAHSELKYYTQQILLRDTDQMSMAHGLEVRVPFLSEELVEFMLGIEDRVKQGPNVKQLLIDSFRDELPAEIYNRPKMGFFLPWDAWLRNELADYCRERIADLGNRELFNKKEMLLRWDQFRKGDKQIGWSRWWLLVVLDNWLTTNKVEIG